MSQLPEALVPDVWRGEPARCTNCGGTWHAERRGPCETSCLNQPIFPQLTMPRLWWDDADCG